MPLLWEILWTCRSFRGCLKGWGKRKKVDVLLQQCNEVQQSVFAGQELLGCLAENCTF